MCTHLNLVLMNEKKMMSVTELIVMGEKKNKRRKIGTVGQLTA